MNEAPNQSSKTMLPLLAAMLRFLLVIGFILMLWQAAIWCFAPARFLFPSPHDVALVFKNRLPYLLSNSLITLQEMLFGLVAGSAFGILVALLLSSFKTLDRYLMPLVVTTQTLPVFAIAPLLVIWFGFGIGSKIVMAALIIFFPVASSFYDGLKSTPAGWLDLGQNWGASKSQLLWHLRIPSALPQLMTGLKLAATVAPIGAIVGEWAGASGGLGFVMLQANARTQTDVVFASLVVLAFAAWLLRFVTVKLADRTVWWAAHSN